MAVIDFNDTFGRIIFMEGWDGSCPYGDVQKGLWPNWRLWFSGSYDPDSPGAQGDLATPVRLQIEQDGHKQRDAEGGWEETSWMYGMERKVVLRAPNGSGFPNGCTLVYRTGSGVDTDIVNGFPDIVDCGGASGLPVYLGFAFRFPADDNGGAITGSQSGRLKVWMGDSAKNGYSNSGVAKFGSTETDLPVPGEPNRVNNGSTAWNGSTHRYQERRLAIEINSGSVDNILMYRSNNGSDVDTTWATTGSYPIECNRWYWACWELKAESNGNGGYSKLYMFNSTVPVVEQTALNCTDTENSTIISNIAFAFRGANNGLANANFPGTFVNETFTNNEVFIDDIVLFYNKKPAETYCTILTASVGVETNYNIINTSSIAGAVVEYLSNSAGGVSFSTQFYRVPNTASWMTTQAAINELKVTKFATFPYTSSAATIYGVQSHAFCASDNATFEICSQSLDFGSSTTSTKMSTIPKPDSVKRTMNTSDANAPQNPFIYVQSKIWPSGSGGIGDLFTTSNINTLTRSVILGS